MFITSAAFRSPISSLFCEPGETVWTATELALQQTWFLAYFEQLARPGDAGSAYGRTMLFAEFRSVEQLINLGPKDGMHLKSVHILTPSHMNGTTTWKMDQIGVVWLSRQTHTECIPMDVFETLSGKKYPASCIGVDVGELQIDSMKFNFIHQSSQTRSPAA